MTRLPEEITRQILNLIEDSERYIAATEQKWQELGYTKAGFNTDQPRVPAGSPGGGQWTGGSGIVAPYDPALDAIEPVYPIEEAILAILPAGRIGTLWRGLVSGLGFSSPEPDEWMLGRYSR